MCRNTRTIQKCVGILVQQRQKYMYNMHRNTTFPSEHLQKYMSTFTEMCQHVQKCSLITYRNIVTNHFSYLSEQPQERIYRNVSTCTEIPLNHMQKYMSTFTEMCQHIQRYKYITDKKYKYNTDICRNTSTTQININTTQPIQKCADIQVQYRNVQKCK